MGKSVAQFESHLGRIHIKEQFEKCPQCDFTCFGNEELRLHEKLHVKEVSVN